VIPPPPSEGRRRKKGSKNKKLLKHTCQRSFSLSKKHKKIKTEATETKQFLVSFLSHLVFIFFFSITQRDSLSLGWI
jgi:hypothetical protein